MYARGSGMEGLGWAVALWVVGVGAQLRIGAGMNLFGRFGYMSISMRVVPRNDSDNAWVFREPVVDIFRDVTATRSSLPGKESTNAVFHGDFHMEFCDDLSQLLQAYFREFTVERLEKPWVAFTGSWNNVTLARNLGLNSSYVGGEHCYVLVRVSRHRDAARLADTFSPDNAHLHEAVRTQAESVKLGDVPTVAKFVRNFGSHYIASYVTGNSLYQVIVYSRSVYKKIKSRIQESGVSSLPNSELTALFSPWYAEHLGLVLPASGNSTVADWANTMLRLRSYIFTYTTLLKLRGNSKLLRELDSLLGNEALLQLHLRTLAPAFKDREKRNWFQEVVDNNLKLWEVNM